MSANIVRQVMEARTRLAESLDDRWYQENIVGHWVESMLGPEYAREAVWMDLARKWRKSLDVAELYGVTYEIGAVIDQAAQDLPDDYRAEHHHLFTDHGLVYLERTLSDAVWMAPVRLLSWHHGSGETRRKPGFEDQPVRVPGLEVNLWAWTQDDWHLGDGEQRGWPGSWCPVGSDFLPYGMNGLGYVLHGYDPVRGQVTETLEEHLGMPTRYVLALQMFMRQELPAIERVRAHRADGRRAVRLHLPVRMVNVIDLRHRKPGPEMGDASGRHLTERHVVRGHWMRFHVGPNHPEAAPGAQDTLVWRYRHAFLRGPEDAPIRPTPARVHAVRR